MGRLDPDLLAHWPALDSLLDEALELLREQGVGRLHSRKLRSFDEPPFR